MFLDREQLDNYTLPTSEDIIQLRFYGEIEDILEDAGIEVYHFPNMVEKYDEYHEFTRKFTDKLMEYYPGQFRMDLFNWIEKQILDPLFNFRIIEIQISTQRVISPVGWIQNRREKTGLDWFGEGSTYER